MLASVCMLRVLRSPSRRLLCPRIGAGLFVGSRALCAPARRAAPAPAAAAPDTAFTDIDVGTWVNRWLPAAAVPFAQLGRWDRPIGTWLLLWPCMWSVALASPPGLPPDLALCAAFGAGAFVMRGAGCTINDLWDREIDRQVERTRMRPLASGAVSVPAAIGFLGAQLTCGLGVLLTLPPSVSEVSAWCPHSLLPRSLGTRGSRRGLLYAHSEGAPPPLRPRVVPSTCCGRHSSC